MRKFYKLEDLLKYESMQWWDIEFAKKYYDLKITPRPEGNSDSQIPRRRPKPTIAHHHFHQMHLRMTERQRTKNQDAPNKQEIDDLWTKLHKLKNHERYAELENRMRKHVQDYGRT